MPDGFSIVNEFDCRYEEAYTAWNPYYPLADRDLRMFLGDQWDAKERQTMYNDARTSWNFNLIQRNINLVTGYQRQHRTSSVVAPIESADQQGADDRTDLLLYAMQAADGYRILSDCFAGACKTGWNLLTMWVDYRDDPINGDIKFGREPYSGFITDP